MTILGKTDKEIRKIWRDFGDIPINDDDEITAEFLDYAPGTYRFDIWHAVDAIYSCGVINIDHDIILENLILNSPGLSGSEIINGVTAEGIVEQLLGSGLDLDNVYDKIRSIDTSAGADELVAYLSDLSENIGSPAPG